jgi:fructose-bisphosphate aldolase class II
LTVAKTLDLVTAAFERRSAVPAFNILDDLSVRAVIDAAEELQLPVILQTSVKTVRMVGAQMLADIVRARASAASVGVALHLDHCPDRAVISECLELGWSSVLFDASSLPLAEALTATQQVVAEAHAVGAQVESEIENISGVEDDVGLDEEGLRYRTDVVVDFVTATNVDMFAPAVGTAHGLYVRRPKLDPGRVSDLVSATGRPMVLHGGTGLTASEFSDFVSRGCAKVNISTAVKSAYMRSALAFLQECETTRKWEPLSLFAHIRSAVTQTAKEHFSLVGGGVTA